MDRGQSHTVWSRPTYWLRDGFIQQSFILCSWPGFCILSGRVWGSFVREGCGCIL